MANKKKKKRSKFNFLKDPHFKMSSIALLTIYGIATGIFLLIPTGQIGQASNSTLPVPQELEEITVDILSQKIEVSEDTVKAGREYNFKLIKSPGSPCAAIKSNELGYSVELIAITTNMPVRIPQAGTYNFSCIGQSLSFTIKAT